VLPTALVYMDALSGERITSVDLGEAFVERYGYPYIVVHRGDLQQVLLDVCHAEDLIEIESGREVSEFRDEGSTAVVACADGAVYRAGVVIAADGVRSRARDLISSGDVNFDGYVAYRGTIDVSDVPSGLETDAMVMWVGPGAHLVQYKVRAGELYNQVAAFRSARFVAGEEDWGGPDELDAHFGNFCEAIRLAITRLSRDRHYAIADRDPTGSWVQNRIALLGDAAHPMLPVLSQGGCQAIEDAPAIAACLADEPQAEAALQLYEAARAPRAGKVQSAARRFADVCHIDGVGIELRNALFGRRSPTDYEALDWLYEPVSLGRTA
jgi:salicylate hydroxylase